MVHLGEANGRPLKGFSIGGELGRWGGSFPQQGGEWGRGRERFPGWPGLVFLRRNFTGGQWSLRCPGFSWSGKGVLLGLGGVSCTVFENCEEQGFGKTWKGPFWGLDFLGGMSWLGVESFPGGKWVFVTVRAQRGLKTGIGGGGPNGGLSRGLPDSGSNLQLHEGHGLGPGKPLVRPCAGGKGG
ncbi:hypothetical protein JTE90_007364 [Oedothorax gibbosus]|uniref:Uncharacterized protein n=1 Tax=Oedothorax gibbosus TaxID=931172 RepID=A0AAV6TCM6_9ARAC|nr:hypothetical protein JTE90_007364 [Oedothorax gibbosus]